MDGCVNRVIVHIFSWFLAVHDQIEHIIGVFLPLCWEEGHNIACGASLLRHIFPFVLVS